MLPSFNTSMRLHPIPSIQQKIIQQGKSSSCTHLALPLETDSKAMRDITSKQSISLYDKLSTCPALNKPFQEKDNYYEPLKDLKDHVNLFLGVGLGSPKGMSKGLPLDVLNMLFVAEGIGSQKYILVADQTAKNNIEHSPDTFSEESIEHYAVQIQEQIQDIISELGLQDWNFVRETRLSSQEDVTSILDNIELPQALEKGILAANRDPMYFKQQYADSAYFEMKKECAVKVGWCSGQKDMKEQFTEAGFDKGFIEVGSSNARHDFGALNFVYTTAGRSFDKAASKSSPYVALDTSARIMLSDKKEQVHSKLTKMEDMRSTSKKKYKACYDSFEKQVISIVDTYNWLIDQGKIKAEKINSSSLEHNINTLLSRVSSQNKTHTLNNTNTLNNTSTLAA